MLRCESELIGRPVAPLDIESYRARAANLAADITIKCRPAPVSVGDPIYESFCQHLNFRPKPRAEGMAKTDRVRGKSDREAKPAEIGVLIYPGVQGSAVGGLT